MTVGRILQQKTGDLVTISPRATLSDAVARLARHHIGAIVVVDEHLAVEGIISERDVVRLLGERGTEALSAPLESVMTRAVVTCTADETVPMIMERMTRGRFRHVPVVDRDRLVGIISIGDVVKHRVEEMEREHAAMRDYIMSA
ncbi:CBS domain-containing protein [Xanthobacter sp. V4C-4]|uniref:CBS domain-containing protein n=1 Tax=Xanthobacter cornucopiae TaxID=3119924 RepID=UPI00372C3B76